MIMGNLVLEFHHHHHRHHDDHDPNKANNIDHDSATKNKQIEFIYTSQSSVSNIYDSASLDDHHHGLIDKIKKKGCDSNNNNNNNNNYNNENNNYNTTNDQNSNHNEKDHQTIPRATPRKTATSSPQSEYDHEQGYGHTKHEEEVVVKKNKLYASLSSLDWTKAVNSIAYKMTHQEGRNSSTTQRSRSSHRRHYSDNTTTIMKNKILYQKTFDRRYGQETKSQAFEQLHVLNDLIIDDEEQEIFGRVREDAVFHGQNDDNNNKDEIKDMKQDEEPQQQRRLSCKEEHVINSRRSQLKRRIFRLQGNVQFDDITSVCHVHHR